MPRRPYPRPEHPDGHDQVSVNPPKIAFRHPGYDFVAQTLLVLPACDNGTIDHEIARIACAVIACNAFDGYLSRDAEGNDRVAGSQLPFREEGYYFQVPGEHLNPYPIYPSFRHYVPPIQLPLSWAKPEILPAPEQASRASSDPAIRTTTRDGTCRISNHIEKTEAAHIVPDGESEWFLSTHLADFATLDHERNRLSLRRDIHQLWDSKDFSIVPRYQMEGENLSAAWVAYVTKSEPRQEILRLYHDVCLQPLIDVHPHFLFSRFVWHVLDGLHVFLQKSFERWLMIKDPKSGKGIAIKCSARQCQDQHFLRRTRSQSPKKRPAPDVEEEEEQLWGESSGQSTCSRRSYSESSSSWMSEGEERGRKRRKSRGAYIDTSQLCCLEVT